MTISSPDGSFHAARILRASQGEFFVDPFTGVRSIYPSLFHVFFGQLNRILNLTPQYVVQMIILLDFIGLFAAVYYLASSFFDTAEQASLCVLSLPLVFYAPTSRYLLLPQPSSFSFVFLIFGMGAMYRYIVNRKPVYLLCGGVLVSLAVNVWWAHAFTVVAIILLLLYYTATHGPIPRASHLAVLLFALALPCTYTVWEFYVLGDILHRYAATARNVNYLDLLYAWLITFFTKGNLQFLHHVNFWDLSAGPSSVSGILPDWVKRLYAFVSFFQYFVLVLPFNLLLIGLVSYAVMKTNRPAVTRVDLARPLAIGGILALLLSFFVILFMSASQLRRVHFVVYILFLIFAYVTVPRILAFEKLKKISVYVCIAALFSLTYTVLYSPRLFAGSVPVSDAEIVRFVASIPDHEDERIFMLEGGLIKIAPFVTFRSFVQGERVSYYLQDPITGSKLADDFETLKQQRADWKNIGRQLKIKWLIFHTSDPVELAVFAQYERQGSVHLKNRDWTVMQLGESLAQEPLLPSRAAHVPQ
jgi:hypothetical protein